MLLERKDIDAVVIATWIIQSPLMPEAGKDVYVEKPVHKPRNCLSMLWEPNQHATSSLKDVGEINPGKVVSTCNGAAIRVLCQTYRIMKTK